MRVTVLPLVLAAALVGGCNGPAALSRPSAPATVNPAAVAGADAPTIDGAKALAQEEVNRYGAGDAAGAWDLLDTASQAQVSRADYIAVHDACPLRAPAYTIKSARLETPIQAVITVGFLGTTQAYKTNFEGGQWRWQMASSDAASYKGGAAVDVARLKKLGLC